MSDSEAVRRSVSADYARAVTSPKTGCCGDKTPKGVAARIAGYTDSEIAALPAGSVDWVISNCAINLSAEKSRVFAEIARVLKIHGAMLVSDIVAEKLPIKIVENPRLYSSCLAGAISECAYVDGLRRAGLAGIEAVDRLIYDAEQLELFIGSELQEPGEGCCCGGGAVDPALVRSWAGQLAGKIASIKIRARKPE